jgi:hypothetical protein
MKWKGLEGSDHGWIEVLSLHLLGGTDKPKENIRITD